MKSNTPPIAALHNAFCRAQEGATRRRRPHGRSHHGNRGFLGNLQKPGPSRARSANPLLEDGLAARTVVPTTKTRSRSLFENPPFAFSALQGGGEGYARSTWFHPLKTPFCSPPDNALRGRYRPVEALKHSFRPLFPPQPHFSRLHHHRKGFLNQPARKANS